MLSYDVLKDRPRDFLAATSLTLGEFHQLLPTFQEAYAQRYPHELTRAGKHRQRRVGGGAKGVLQRVEDKLSFILVFQKTHPLQTMPALQCARRQPQANYWIHYLLPLLQQALAGLGMRPERDAHRVATAPLVQEGGPALALDGTERRRQRPTDPAQQQEHDSGKKKTPTNKNLLLVNEHTGKVVYLGPTIAGKTHDKKPADAAQIAYPVNATLDKDTGFQGYEPAGVLTQPPKKTARAGIERGQSPPESPFLQCACGGGKRDCRGQTVSDCQRCLASDDRRESRICSWRLRVACTISASVVVTRCPHSMS
jgi:hypothetical protein